MCPCLWLMGAEITEMTSVSQTFPLVQHKRLVREGLGLITLSTVACVQQSQVLEPSRIYQVQTLCTILQHPVVSDGIWKQTKTQLIICVDGKRAEQ